MNRREVIQAAAAWAGAARFRRPERARLDRIGLELYSVRDAMRLDPEGTMAKVRDMGYADVELLWSFNNFGRTAQQVADTLRRLGLNAPSAHIAPDTLLKNWQQSLDTANLLGHQYLIVPSLPGDTSKSLDRWRAWADNFNVAGEAARKSGLWLAFHNEPDHQHPIDGQVPYDVFVQHTDPKFVRLQLDVGNMMVGGGDPHAYLAAHAERYWSFHLKDVSADRKHDTDMGTGAFDFKRFLAAVKDLGHKPCYVEQESSPDPLASARRNCGYLKGLTF
jgi:sugar phosphate isomerase/epimerase